jgi:hypothetical protein
MRLSPHGGVEEAKPSHDQKCAFRAVDEGTWQIRCPAIVENLDYREETNGKRLMPCSREKPRRDEYR